jgi:hypothetical protein
MIAIMMMSEKASDVILADARGNGNGNGNGNGKLKEGVIEAGR